jgi:hypothetical protein
MTPLEDFFLTVGIVLACAWLLVALWCLWGLVKVREEIKNETPKS